MARRKHIFFCKDREARIYASRLRSGRNQGRRKVEDLEEKECHKCSCVISELLHLLASTFIFASELSP